MATERRLIDAVALADEVFAITVRANVGRCNGKTLLNEILEKYRNEVLQTICKSPTVDAVEVVHGRWIYEEEPDKDNNVQANCSVCFAGDLHATAMMNKVPYCWKCGAKMDGERKDNDGNN